MLEPNLVRKPTFFENRTHCQLNMAPTQLRGKTGFRCSAGSELASNRTVPINQDHWAALGFFAFRDFRCIIWGAITSSWCICYFKRKICDTLKFILLKVMSKSFAKVKTFCFVQSSTQFGLLHFQIIFFSEKLHLPCMRSENTNLLIQSMKSHTLNPSKYYGSRI